MKKNLATLFAAAAITAINAFAADEPPKVPPKDAPKATTVEQPKLEASDEPHSYKKCVKICVVELGDREKCERICDQTPKK